ncbi:putative estradiol 17 beta-dehydrogenase [Periconia macrospinosa]|uniref:Putative estradiol 17 beta-dehydrogenase n=1 Tax=Periconia macrospinosa TaxID=97972 RepID=A0A2V1D7M1_9PLEO|nr:putative estradiol 17 beta-dehydrogenase [Periconia macrospinosa]
MPSLSTTWTNFHPPSPDFTEEKVPNLQGKVYIVTGANTGVGKEIARILYSKDAKVYVAARSEQKATDAIASMKQYAPSSKGELIYLHLDLSDLSLVKQSAQRFLSQETRLNVLFNNAGVMTGNTEPPPTTAQHHELNMGVNCIATFLFTKLLTPILAQTAKSEPAGTVRVTWPSSFATEMYGETDTGIDMNTINDVIEKPTTLRYGISKTGTWELGVEYAKKHAADGIVSIPLNPGNLTSELARDQTFSIKLAAKVLGYPPVKGACTQLFAGLSPEVTLEKSGRWVVPFGRFYPIREDLLTATKSVAEGGNGSTEKFWAWNKDQVKNYL